MNFNAEIYGKLLNESLPGVIASETEYSRLEEHFNRLISRGEDKLSPEETRLFELLANLLENYEARTLPPLANAAPRDILKFLMDQNDLRQKDLLDVFGTESRVSEAVAGKREISKSQAKKLAARFRVSAELFI